jgi:CxxC-x17-CxxC domain-containing protein
MGDYVRKKRSSGSRSKGSGKRSSGRGRSTNKETGNFQRSGGSRGRSSGGRSGGRDRGRGELTMHKVICDKCKAKCEVPFLPNENKPVYCSDCFRTEGPPSPASVSAAPSSRSLDEINKKLDKILAILDEM